jgi:hypothetical protein
MKIITRLAPIALLFTGGCSADHDHDHVHDHADHQALLGGAAIRGSAMENASMTLGMRVGERVATARHFQRETRASGARGSRVSRAASSSSPR